MLGFFGDVEAVAADELARWNDLADGDLVLGLRTDRVDARIDDLDEPERFRYRLRHAASRMSLDFLDLFDEIPDSIDEFDDEEHAVGWGVCLHHLVDQLGYQANGGEEEIDLMFQGVVGRLHAMAAAPGYGPEAAEAKVEELAAKLESLPSELRRLHDDRP